MTTGNAVRRQWTSKGLLAAIVAASALTAGGAVTAPAAAETGDGQAPAGVGDHTWTVTPTTFELVTGPGGDIPVTIDADLWKPDDASAANPVPAIIHQHGYGGAKDNEESRTNAAYFASHGYVVVTVSTQGFGGSTGCIALDTVQYDGANTSAIIDWLANQDYVATNATGDPKVGLMGGSYGGGHQGLVGVEDDRVDAIAPGRTWSSLQFSLVPNNWQDPADPWDLDHYEQGVFKREWTSLFFAVGAARGAPGGSCDEPSRQTVYGPAAPCPGYIPGVCAVYEGLSSTGTADQAGRDLVAGSARATRLAELTVPTILAQGLPDTLFTPTETVPELLALQDRGVPVAVLWISSGHGGFDPVPGDGEPYTGTFDETPERQAEFADTYWARRHLAWFDRHVRGDESVDTGPTFAWFRPWVEYDVAATGGTAAPAYGTATSYPVGTPTVFSLDPADDALVPAGTAVTGGTASFTNPAGGQPTAYSETANFSSPGDVGDQPATEQPGQHVAFTTAPFDEPVEVVGVPELQLHLAHANTLQDAVLFVKLYDVDPDGNATLIRRQVAPARVPTDALDAGPVGIHLVGTSWRFEAGHAARLVLAATDAAYYNNPAADQLTVTSTVETPSTLTLPVVAAAGTSDTDAASGAGVDAADAGTADEATVDGRGLAATGGGAALAALVAVGAAVLVRPRRRDRG